MDSLNYFLHIFMLILFVGWGAFFLYCLFRFRRREGVGAQYEPIHAKGAKALEVGVVLVELALLFLISVPVWSTIKTGFNEVDKKNAVLVRVIGEQFAWNFHYAGADGVFGKTDIKKMDAGNPIGLDRSDVYAKDDVVSREMRLPVNRDVIAYLSSKDVIHSFGVHELRVKHDLVPGLEIPIWFHVTKTSEEMRQSGAEMVPVAKAARLPSYVAMQDYGAGLTKGSAVTQDLVAALQQAGVQEVLLGRRDPIEISCSQLCGLGHYRMKGVMTVETEEQYAQWLASRAPKAPGAPAAPAEPPAAPAPAEGTSPTPAEGTAPAPAPAEGTAPAPAPAEGTAPAPAEGTAPASGEPSEPAPQPSPSQP